MASHTRSMGTEDIFITCRPPVASQEQSYQQRDARWAILIDLLAVPGRGGLDNSSLAVAHGLVPGLLAEIDECLPRAVLRCASGTPTKLHRP